MPSPITVLGLCSPIYSGLQSSNSLSSVQIPFPPEVRHVYLPALSIFQSCPYVGFYRLSLANIINNLHTRAPNRYSRSIVVCQLLSLATCMLCGCSAHKQYLFFGSASLCQLQPNCWADSAPNSVATFWDICTFQL